MSSILRISEGAVLALHTVSLLTQNPGKRVSNTEISDLFHCSTNTLSKVLQRLTRSGYISSTRGPAGGFELTVDPNETTMLEILEAVDGVLLEDGCLLGRTRCADSDCVLGNLVQNVQVMVCNSFRKTTLADLAESMTLGDGQMTSSYTPE